MHNRSVQGREAATRNSIWIGTSLEQQPSNVDVAHNRRVMQRHVSRVIPALHVESACYEGLRRDDVVLGRALVQKGLIAPRQLPQSIVLTHKFSRLNRVL